ncbi:MAG: hypothetical protein WCL04_01975 [Verrucomicrobiota bacterium]
MTKEERGQLMRARFRALGGLPYINADVPRKPKGDPVRPTKGISWGLLLVDDRKQWVSRPDPMPAKPLGKRNRAGKPAVVSIAEKQPEKPVRRGYWLGGKFIP